MRLDHLLSKEDRVGIVLLFRGQCLLEQGSYTATKFERTSLSGQVTTFTLDSLVLQAYQVFTVMYLENYILKMIRHQTVRFKFYKHIFFFL